jgi:hypothetical protein
MTRIGKHIVAPGLMTAAFTPLASAADLTSTTSGDARAKVVTAAALANIAMSEKDGDALIVATRMLVTADPLRFPVSQVPQIPPNQS